MKPWLVEIRLKDWRPTLPDGTNIVTFEEVMASNQYEARHSGFSQFSARCVYEPGMRRRMQVLNLTELDCCAPDAVELDT